jgi:endonuclease G
MQPTRNSNIPSSGTRFCGQQKKPANRVFPQHRRIDPNAPTIDSDCLTITMDAASFSPAGYDADFLDVPLPLPTPPAGALMRELLYTHFTVLLYPARRLAIATGVNIDGDQLVTVERANNWHLDARIPVYEQAGEGVYARNDLDRGHLVRRQDPVWGDEATARRANYDTFAYTNAAPQAAAFNQSKQLWLGLEDHVLTYARTNANRMCFVRWKPAKRALTFLPSELQGIC